MFIIKPDYTCAIFYTSVSTQIVSMFINRIRRSKHLPMAVGFIINGNLPFLTAGDGTCGGDAVKFIVIVGMNVFYINWSSL